MRGDTWQDPGMTIPNESVHPFPSTKWEYRKIRVRSGQAPAGDSPSAARTFKGLRARDTHKSLWIEVRYVGGSQASWLIKARGRIERFPGYLELDDVLRRVNGGEWY